MSLLSVLGSAFDLITKAITWSIVIVAKRQIPPSPFIV
ncbi:unnamed protein product, partial [Rotaria magnacalcarata]